MTERANVRSAAPMPTSPSAYPPAERQDVVDTLHGVAVPDPYRWLEDPKSPQSAAFMKAEDEAARAALAAIPARPGLAKRLSELFYHDAVFAPYHRGNRYFYSRRHATKEKAVVYWKEGESGDERVLFDPNTMSEDGSVSLVGWYPSRDGTRVAYKLSRNNADEATMYLRDVAAGTDSAIDVIEGAKYAGASWTPDGKGFYYTRLPTDPTIPVADRPGFADVRYHAIGTDPKDDVLVHPATGNPTQFIGADVSRDGTWLILEIQHGWTSNDVYIRPLDGKSPPVARLDTPVGEGFTKLVVGNEALYEVTYWKGHVYVSTNEGATRYRVFKVDPNTPDRASWREIVAESDAKLDAMQIVGDHLVLTYLRNALSEMEIRDLEGNLVRKVPLPGIGSTTGMVGTPEGDDAYFYFSSFVDVPQIQRTSIKTGKTSLWAKIDYPVDTSSMVAEQLFFPSKDGTRVSMFVMHKKDVTPNGDRPTLLYGYGGFNNKLTPWFSASIVAWLELGGVYAVANLRGGGEYGEDWHRDGMLEKKQNVFDDFIAAGEHLVSQGWTKPARLGIQGGSNGGLLVGAVMTQRPDLFGAVVCAVPLLDMVRYHLFGSGKTWISEYGSADDPSQFKALHAYSPYHHVKEGTAYPALLVLSADSDDRVDPMHARKFAAAVQWANRSDKPVLLRIETNAGHGGGDMVKKDVERVADTYAFLAWQLGIPVP
jgi:prolyl oligopeptidase